MSHRSDRHRDLVRELAGIADRLTSLVVVLAERFGPVHVVTHRASQVARGIDRLRAVVHEHDELERDDAS